MRKALCLIAFICIICMSQGCVTKTALNNGYTFTDDLGRNVTVTSCERTAALLGSFADVWMLSGGEICATADDAWDDFELDLSDDAVNLGKTKNLSLEKLLASKPEFVLASTATKQHIEWKETLETAGITVAYFEVTEFDDYLRMLKICTDINKKPDLYKKYGTDMNADIDKIIQKGVARVKKHGTPEILYLRASASFIRVKNSRGTVMGEMLSDLGCENIADSNTNLLEKLSMESILSGNPQHIFIVPSGDDYDGMKKAVENMFAENPAWNSIDAVKTGNVHYMDKKLYNLKPNSRWSEAYEKLEEILAQ